MPKRSAVVLGLPGRLDSSAVCFSSSRNQARCSSIFRSHWSEEGERNVRREGEGVRDGDNDGDGGDGKTKKRRLLAT